MNRQRKFRVAFAFCAAASLAIVAAVLWRVGLFSSAVSGDDRFVFALLALGGIAGAFFYVWVTVENRILQPLDALKRDAETALHARPERPVDVRADTLVEPLAHVVERLVRQRDRERNEVHRALASATARIEEERRHLASVLSPLREGVVMCNASQMVVLHNEAAYQRLSPGSEFGLGKSIFTALDRASVEQALANLAGAANGDETPFVDADVALAGGGATLSVRVARLAEADGDIFVYSFDPAAAHAQLPPRPVNYDFSLLRRDAAPTALSERPLAQIDYVAFDTETTGLAPSKGDRIVQIGAVRVVNGALLAGESFQRLVNPERPIPPRSTRFHGITDDMVAHQPTIDDVVPAFRAFVGDAAMIAQNAAFDLSFLRATEARAGVRFDTPVLDTMLLSMALHPDEADHTLDGLIARYGVDISGRHTALGDAMATARVFVRMLDLLDANGIRTLAEADKASARAADRLRRATGYGRH